MKILLPPHYNPSMKVQNWLQIESDALEMAKLVDGEELCDRSVALHHAQVCEKPFNFFVINPKHIKEQVEGLGSRYIINPRIVALEPGAMVFVDEGCLSFPHRKMRKKERCLVAQVEYQIFDGKELITKEVLVDRIIAQMFQHECEHGEGRNMYFNSAKPN
jgi:peptide deformylase